MTRRSTLPRVLDADEQDALLAQFNDRYWSPHRDRTAVLVMLDAGLRVSEVCALELAHADLARRKLTVREGKGDVDRVVPVCPRLADALAAWMDRRPEAVDQDSQFLFPTRKGKAVHPNHLRRSVKRAARKADLPEADRISPHTLRHTAAVDLLRETGRLEVVRDFLGHASVQTTEIYARLVNDELEAAVSSFRTGDDENQTEESLADVLADLDAETRDRLLTALQATG